MFVKQNFEFVWFFIVFVKERRDIGWKWEFNLIQEKQTQRARERGEGVTNIFELSFAIASNHIDAFIIIPNDDIPVLWDFFLKMVFCLFVCCFFSVYIYFSRFYYWIFYDFFLSFKITARKLILHWIYSKIFTNILFHLFFFFIISFICYIIILQ